MRQGVGNHKVHLTLAEVARQVRPDALGGRLRIFELEGVLARTIIGVVANRLRDEEELALLMVRQSRRARLCQHHLFMLPFCGQVSGCSFGKVEPQLSHVPVNFLREQLQEAAGARGYPYLAVQVWDRFPRRGA